MLTEQGIFINRFTNISLVVYIDNVLIRGDNINRIARLKQDLATLLELSSLGEAKFFLGIDIIRDRSKSTLYLKETKFTRDILAKYSKQGLTPVSTPAEAGIRFDKNQN